MNNPPAERKPTIHDVGVGEHQAVEDEPHRKGQVGIARHAGNRRDEKRDAACDEITREVKRVGAGAQGGGDAMWRESRMPAQRGEADVENSPGGERMGKRGVARIQREMRAEQVGKDAAKSDHSGNAPRWNAGLLRDRNPTASENQRENGVSDGRHRNKGRDTEPVRRGARQEVSPFGSGMNPGSVPGIRRCAVPDLSGALGHCRRDARKTKLPWCYFRYV